MLALFLFLLASLSVFAPAQTDAERPAVLGKLVDVGGYRVHLYCTGQGSPTVVVASGGFSFDWGLVQPKVERFTRICTYDPAGTAWSDPIPGQTNPTCIDRITELHQLLHKAGIGAPYVLVGFSIGGLVARLYAALYPEEIAGMVVVDHAFLGTQASRTAASISAMRGLNSPPVLIFKTPITLDLEDDQNFNKLPERDQELHRWALSIHSLRPTPEMAAVCFSEVDRVESKLPFPLGNRPLAVVSTLYDSSSYRELQHQLLMLSHNSKQWMAENSSHMVIIDQPEIVVQAIENVVTAARMRADSQKP